MSEPLVACVNHPARFDVDALRQRLSGCPRPIEVLAVPYKEDLERRGERAAGAMPAARPFDDSVREAWRRAEALLALDLPPEATDLARGLRFVQAYSAGIDHFDRRALAHRGVALATAAGMGAGPIAEFVLARVLEVVKRTREVEAMQRERRFHRPSSGQLSGAVLCIVGLGEIGRAVAARARPFGMRVVATRRSHRPGMSDDDVDELHAPSALPSLLARADVVVLSASLNPTTRDLIDAAALGCMKPGAILCNVARGAMVDEAALGDALRTGAVGAAILDVTREEPLPPDDPLWEAPNLYLSPHCAVSPEAYDERVLELFAENLERLVSGGSLRNLARETDTLR